LLLGSTTTNLGKNPKENLKNASQSVSKKFELPELTEVMKIDMSPSFIARSLSTVVLREKTMSIDAWILDSMHDVLSPQPRMPCLMAQMKSVQCEQYHKPPLIAELRRRPGTILFEPVFVPMQTVNDLAPQSCMRDAPQSLWLLLDRPCEL
jgi:hypothetical protein